MSIPRRVWPGCSGSPHPHAVTQLTRVFLEQPVVTRRTEGAPTEDLRENAALRRERDAHKRP